jgi:hypothetical protein
VSSVRSWFRRQQQDANREMLGEARAKRARGEELDQDDHYILHQLWVRRHERPVRTFPVKAR